MQHGSTTSPHLASRLLRRIYVKPHCKHTVQTSSAAPLVYWPSWLIVSVLLLAAGHKRCLSLRLWGFSVTAVVPLLSLSVFLVACSGSRVFILLNGSLRSVTQHGGKRSWWQMTLLWILSQRKLAETATVKIKWNPPEISMQFPICNLAV